MASPTTLLDTTLQLQLVRCRSTQPQTIRRISERCRRPHLPGIYQSRAAMVVVMLQTVTDLGSAALPAQHALRPMASVRCAPSLQLLSLLSTWLMLAAPQHPGVRTSTNVPRASTPELSCAYRATFYTSHQACTLLASNTRGSASRT